MTLTRDPAWSDAVAEADWIKERLTDDGVTSVVPSAFEEYARVLHPAETPHSDGGHLVRWRDVSEWSGTPLRSDSQFHSIARAPKYPDTEPPWRGQGPREGLFEADAAVLAEILRDHTSTPEQCWFCIWDGYGRSEPLTVSGEIPIALPDPIPADVLSGPRVHLPGRDYFLHAGPVEAVLTSLNLEMLKKLPNLWWPRDHEWCVASDIDLTWTYVGRSRTLIDRMLTEARIEALPASPDDRLTGVEEWVTRLVDDALDDLLRTGVATIVSSNGTVQARLERPSHLRRGVLSTIRLGDNEVYGSGQHMLDRLEESALRKMISCSLTDTVVELVARH
jgi:hypothetical protein